MSTPHLTLTCCVLSVAIADSCGLRAETYPERRRTVYVGIDPLAARSSALADRIEATGLHALYLSQAAINYQEALRLRIDNDQRLYVSRLGMRRLRNDEINQRKLANFNAKRHRAARDHALYSRSPEQNVGRIHNGEALNFYQGLLLDELTLGQLDGVCDPSTCLVSSLDAKRLVVQEAAPGSRRLRFRLSAGTPHLEWPSALQSESVQRDRTAFERGWNAVLNGDVTKTVDIAAIDTLREKLDDLATRFRDVESDCVTGSALEQFIQRRDADGYLRELADSLARMRSSRRQLVADDERRSFNGGSVVELLEHMATHGLTFAPARSSSDYPAYFNVYRQLRRIHSEVSENDPALRGLTMDEYLAKAESK